MMRTRPLGRTIFLCAVVVALGCEEKPLDVGFTPGACCPCADAMAQTVVPPPAPTPEPAPHWFDASAMGLLPGEGPPAWANSVYHPTVKEHDLHLEEAAIIEEYPIYGEGFGRGVKPPGYDEAWKAWHAKYNAFLVAHGRPPWTLLR